ncbi:MAG: hypothetical protein ABSG21_08840 [Spirochaetia bacterium]
MKDGDKIIMDTGTAMHELARLLGENRDLSVVTNDLPIALLPLQLLGDKRPQRSPDR